MTRENGRETKRVGKWQTGEKKGKINRNKEKKEKEVEKEKERDRKLKKYKNRLFKLASNPNITNKPNFFIPWSKRLDFLFHSSSCRGVTIFGYWVEDNETLFVLLYMFAKSV